MQYPVPSNRDLMWPTIEALRKLDGSGRIAEISEEVVLLTGLAEDQQSSSLPVLLQSDLDSRLAWARTALKHSGLIENSSRGVWSLTENGRNCKEKQAISAYQAYWDHLKSRRTEKKGGLKPLKGQEQGEAEITGVPEAADADRTWQDELLDRLKNIEPDAFERLTQRLLREAGFRNVKVLGRSGDGASMVWGSTASRLSRFRHTFSASDTRERFRPKRFGTSGAPWPDEGRRAS